MKFALAMTAILFSTLAFAGESVCTGKVSVTNAYVPAPIERDATVTIQPSLAELKNGGTATVTADIGGDPMVYQGEVDLTGIHDQKKVDQNNGDIFTFKIKAISDSQISYQAKFTDSNLQEQGAVKEATLDCK